MKQYLRLAIALAFGLPAAALAENVTVNINGQQISVPVQTVGGKKVAAMPLDFLKSSGALVAGGAKQMDALQGCLGQTLFNGVWKFRVTRQHDFPGNSSNKYWGFDIEVSNGTQKNLYSWEVIDNENIVMIDKNGQTFPTTTPIVNGETSGGMMLPPGGKGVFSYQGHLDGQTPPMTKILIPMEKGTDLPFIKTPNLRIDLTCQK